MKWNCHGPLGDGWETSLNVEALDPQDSKLLHITSILKSGSSLTCLNPNGPISMINLIFYGLVDTYQMNESYVSYRIMINIYIYHIYLYQYFLKVKPPGKSFFVFILVAMGLLSNFCFFAELLGILRPLLFAMSLPMSLYIPSPKTMEETRSFFFHKEIHTHPHEMVLFRCL